MYHHCFRRTKTYEKLKNITAQDSEISVMKRVSLLGIQEKSFSNITYYLSPDQPQSDLLITKFVSGNIRNIVTGYKINSQGACICKCELLGLYIVNCNVGLTCSYCTINTHGTFLPLNIFGLLNILLVIVSYE